jgi:hypothetical protein
MVTYCAFKFVKQINIARRVNSFFIIKNSYINVSKNNIWKHINH